MQSICAWHDDTCQPATVNSTFCVLHKEKYAVCCSRNCLPLLPQLCCNYTSCTVGLPSPKASGEATMHQATKAKAATRRCLMTCAERTKCLQGTPSPALAWRGCTGPLHASCSDSTDRAGTQRMRKWSCQYHSNQQSLATGPRVGGQGRRRPSDRCKQTVDNIPALDGSEVRGQAGPAAKAESNRCCGDGLA